MYTVIIRQLLMEKNAPQPTAVANIQSIATCFLHPNWLARIRDTSTVDCGCAVPGLP